MKLKNLMVFNAIVALPFGIGFVIVPSFILSIYGCTQGPTEIFLSQLFGVCLLQFSVLMWFIREMTDPKVLKAIILSFLITNFFGVFVAAKATLSGVMNPMGWLPVAIYLSLTLGYAYFQFMKPSTS